MSEAEEIPRGRPRRPVLSRRHGVADHLLDEYARHEIAAIRAECWYPAVVGAFTMRAGGASAPSAETIARIQHTGRVLSRVKRDKPAHYAVIRRNYFDERWVSLGALRLALQAFADQFDAMHRAPEMFFRETVDFADTRG